jgi:hypothetical protein
MAAATGGVYASLVMSVPLRSAVGLSCSTDSEGCSGGSAPIESADFAAIMRSTRSADRWAVETLAILVQ